MDEFQRRLIIEAILGFKPEVKQTLVEICKDPNASLEKISERVFINGVSVSSNTVKNYARVIYASLHINDKSEISDDICNILQQIERGEITEYLPPESEISSSETTGTEAEAEDSSSSQTRSIENETRNLEPTDASQPPQQSNSMTTFLQEFRESG